MIFFYYNIYIYIYIYIKRLETNTFSYCVKIIHTFKRWMKNANVTNDKNKILFAFHIDYHVYCHMA